VRGVRRLAEPFTHIKLAFVEVSPQEGGEEVLRRAKGNTVFQLTPQDKLQPLYEGSG
jgi:hypothetical protein